MEKTKKIEIRVDILEAKLIKSKAKERGLTTSEYLRRLGLNQELTPVLSDEEKEILKDLKKYHNNFSAISNLFKKGDYPKMIEEIDDLKKELKEVIQAFRKNDK